VVTLFDDQAIVTSKVGQNPRHTLAGKVGRCSTQDAMVQRQARGNEMRGNLIAHTHIQVESFCRYVDQPIEYLEPHLQCWVLLDHLRDGRSDDVPAKPEAAADADQPPRRTALVVDVFIELLDLIEDAQRSVVDPLAFFSDDHPAGRAMDQPCTQGLFKNANAFVRISANVTGDFGNVTGLSGWC
jgi:hypothetical protein